MNGYATYCLIKLIACVIVASVVSVATSTFWFLNYMPLFFGCLISALLCWYDALVYGSEFVKEMQWTI